MNDAILRNHASKLLAVACGALITAAACASDEASSGSGGAGGKGNAGSGGTLAGSSGSGGSTGGASGSVGTGGTSAGGAGGSTGGTGGSTCADSAGVVPSACGAAPVGGAVPLIDDLEDNNGALPEEDGRLGFWFIYNDKTPGAVQEPSGAEFLPEAPGHASGYAARTHGADFVEYAGVGLSIRVVGQFNCPYDAKAFTGIKFWAKGPGAVRMQIATSGTTPEAGGGSCACECFNHYGKDITFTAEWAEYTFAWADLAQQSGWGSPVAFDPATINAIQFQVGPNATFDFSIDDMSFTGGGGGTGGTGGDSGSTGGSAGAGTGGTGGGDAAAD